MSQDSNVKAAEKSKAMICNALMELLKTENYNSLTITQICSSAGVSRPTFYKNFQSIDAVVYYKLKEIEINYHSSQLMGENFHERLKHFYSFAKNNEELGFLLIKNKLFYIFEELIRNDFLAYIAVQKEWVTDEFLRKYLPDYLSSTLVSLLQKWIESGYHESPEQMTDITLKLMQGYLELHSSIKEKK